MKKKKGEDYNYTESILFVLICEKSYLGYKEVLNTGNNNKFLKYKNIKEGDLVMEITSFFNKKMHGIRTGFALSDFDSRKDDTLEIKLLDGRIQKWTNCDFINIGFDIENNLLEQIKGLNNANPKKSSINEQ